MIRSKNIAFIAVLVFLAGCGGSTKLKKSPPPPNDMRPVPAPESREINLAADNMNKLVTIQVQRFFDLARHYRSLTKNPGRQKILMNLMKFIIPVGLTIAME